MIRFERELEILLDLSSQSRFFLTIWKFPNSFFITNHQEHSGIKLIEDIVYVR